MARTIASAGGPVGRERAILLGVLACIALAHLLAFWPGIMVWDAIRQYRQALGGQYDDWHPPAMNWLWRRLLPLHAGPAPMLVVQVALYWAGFALLAVAAMRRGRRGSAWALAAVALLPIPLMFVGTVLKDSLMAGLLLVATGLGARGGADRRARGLALALLIGAATLRFNAAPACLPLAWMLLPERWRASRPKAVVAIGAALLLFVAAMPLANRLLRAEPSGVELSLAIYDLGGITHFSGVDAFPPLRVADPVAVNARCYSPVSWDRYAWWGDDPCPIGFDTIRAVLAARGEGPYRLWLGAIVAHPLAYATHRLAHFNSNTRFLIHDAQLPSLSLASDPNPWGFAVPPDRLRGVIGALALACLATPLGWPAWWLALGLGVLIVGAALPNARTIVPVATSALLYGFSYLPLSVASEVRYHLWTMIGVAVGAVLAAEAFAAGARVGRGRLMVAALPVAIVTLLSIGARLA